MTSWWLENRQTKDCWWRRTGEEACVAGENLISWVFTLFDSYCRSFLFMLQQTRWREMTCYCWPIEFDRTHPIEGVVSDLSAGDVEKELLPPNLFATFCDQTLLNWVWAIDFCWRKTSLCDYWLLWSTICHQWVGYYHWKRLWQHYRSRLEEIVVYWLNGCYWGDV